MIGARHRPAHGTGVAALGNDADRRLRAALHHRHHLRGIRRKNHRQTFAVITTAQLLGIESQPLVAAAAGNDVFRADDLREDLSRFDIVDTINQRGVAELNIPLFCHIPPWILFAPK